MWKISLKSKIKQTFIRKTPRLSLWFYHLCFFSGRGLKGLVGRKAITFWLFLFSLGSLFSCGLANYNFGSSNSKATVLDSRSDNNSTGVFNSPKGRLESSDTCSKSEDCKELCDSMLQRFALQKKCYEYKEVEVQSFRDIYNLLAMGNPRKLARVDTEEMEKFLTFGPELWRDAINGFERGRKEDCTPNSGDNDPTEREDCKLKGYYKQVGYWSDGAVAALGWIARNDWLAELIVRHDEEFIIMTSLLTVVAHGGGQNFTSPDNAIEDPTGRAQTCDLTLNENLGSVNGTCDAGRDDFNGNSWCDNVANTYGRLSPSADTRLDPTASSPPSSISIKLEKEYKAFGADCVKDSDDERQNYFLIAMEDTNKNSLNLGHEVVEKLCSKSAQCIKYFYCHIKEGCDVPIPAPINGSVTCTADTILHYMEVNKGSIGSWDSDYANCHFP